MGELWVNLNDSSNGALINDGQFGGPQGLNYYRDGDGRYRLQNVYSDQPFWADSPCYKIVYTNTDGYVRPDGSGVLFISMVKDVGWPSC